MAKSGIERVYTTPLTEGTAHPRVVGVGDNVLDGHDHVLSVVLLVADDKDLEHGSVLRLRRALLLRHLLLLLYARRKNRPAGGVAGGEAGGGV